MAIRKDSNNFACKIRIRNSHIFARERSITGGQLPYRKTVGQLDKAQTVDLTNCDQEPIHISGHIQPYGLLLCLDSTSLQIEQIGQNIESALGHCVESLLGRPLSCLISNEQLESIRSRLQKWDEVTLPVSSSLDLKKNDGTSETWIGHFHRCENQLILELEKIDPLASDSRSLLSILERSSSLILKTNSEKQLCVVTAREIQRITGYDRVMIYRFDADWNGEVVAEAQNKTGMPSFLGQHFPATDIPSQARKILLSNWIRMIPDVAYEPSPIVPTLNPRTNNPLDLGQAYLRSVSPLHIQYLKNMKVGSTLTISLIDNGNLWGLISCHHKEPKMLDPDLRHICSVIGKLVSSQIRIKIDQDNSYRQNQLVQIHGALVDSMLRDDDPVRGLIKYSSKFLELTDAQGAAVALGESGEWTFLGKTPTKEQIDHLSVWLSQCLDQTHSEVFYSHSLPLQFPEASAYCDKAAGLLAVRIPKGQQNFLLWFKPEVIQTINWAGPPNKDIEKMPDDTLKIEPRLSFEIWKESVANSSKPWSAIEINAAMELQHSVMALDLKNQVKKERQARSQIEQEVKDKKNMFATVSHDLKNPLAAIDLNIQLFEHKYRKAEKTILDPKELFSEASAMHARIQNTIQYMYNLLKDYLGVTKADSGTLILRIKTKDAVRLAHEMVEMLQSLALEKQIRLTTIVHEEGCLIKLDEDRIKQVLSNLISNSLKFTPPHGKITLQLTRGEKDLVFSVQDTGPGIPPHELHHIFERFWQSGAKAERGTGLGLAISKGIIEAHGGRIWAESTVGKGTQISFSLPL
jgi:two-component system, chemotaxis family, sensor kinase Cph1